MGKKRDHGTPPVGFFKKDGKTRPITASKRRPGAQQTQTKLRIVKRIKGSTQGFPYHQIVRVEPMLGDTGTEADLSLEGYGAQRKLDGTRNITIRAEDRCILRGRSWKNDFADRYPEIVEDLKKFQDKRFVLDSELTFFEKETDTDVFITALATPETKAKYDVRLMVFDILHLGDQDLTGKAFEERFKILKDIFPRGLKHVQLVPVVTKTKDKERLYKQTLAKGGEGVMLKRMRSPYLEGHRTADWLKIKKEETDEAIIVGYTTGQGKRASTFGSVILAKHDAHGNLVYVGKTSGFTEKEIETILKRMKRLRVNKNPGVLGAEGSVQKLDSWVEPEIVIEVKFHEKTKTGKFRHPAFVRFRDDKTPDQV